MSKTRRNFSPEFKAQVVLQLLRTHGSIRRRVPSSLTPEEGRVKYVKDKLAGFSQIDKFDHSQLKMFISDVIEKIVVNSKTKTDVEIYYRGLTQELPVVPPFLMHRVSCFLIFFICFNPITTLEQNHRTTHLSDLNQVQWLVFRFIQYDHYIPETSDYVLDDDELLGGFHTYCRHTTAGFGFYSRQKKPKDNLYFHIS